MTDSPATALVAAADPMMMLQSLIERGADPDALKKMMDLADRWKAQKAAIEYAEAMNACQREMPTVVRDKKNDETGKGYAPVETVQTHVKPIYIKHGFSLSFGTEVGSAEGLTHCYVDVRHVGGHVERIFLHNVALDNKGPKGGATKTEVQGLMSSLSYAQGRLIRLAFNITVADQDRDGQRELVTPEQIAVINGLFDQCEKAGGPVDLKLFLAWLKIPSLDLLPSKRFPLATDELNRKLRALEKAKKGSAA